MGEWHLPAAAEGEDVIESPVAVVGVEGIYDLRLLGERFSAVPMYHQFLEGAFGPDMAKWDAASPTHGKYTKTWIGGRLAVLVHSDGDQLVDWGQVERMQATLKREHKDGRNDVVFEVQGNHDEVWKDGKELAKGIKYALSLLTQ